jgi:adenosylcobinamide-phosphate guanylyltransferase
MRVPALIMAGGKSKRMGLAVEKPLLLFLGKPLIDWVAESVSSAEKVSEFFIVTSANAPETEKHCKKKGWKVLRTDAKGYHDDLKQAINGACLDDAVLTIPADLPALTGRFLDKVVNAFEFCGKEFLAVFVPIRKREDLGLSVSSIDEYEGVWHAVAGVNIVNAKKIKEGGKIETSAIITEETEVLLNINTLKDFEIADRIMRDLRKRQSH